MILPQNNHSERNIFSSNCRINLYRLAERLHPSAPPLFDSSPSPTAREGRAGKGGRGHRKRSPRPRRQKHPRVSLVALQPFCFVYPRPWNGFFPSVGVCAANPPGVRKWASHQALESGHWTEEIFVRDNRLAEKKRMNGV
ncbi:hypothetical protein CDAR_109211 [Caerostris darwini]|uniref:Uncharacterized protein n=1 Tax=Caerostris darwini TaxID=1538125 RepID=A0AAV4TVK8_9ARAC|nr:hypothetical protein CDAR_109211 [Caerostris darwini]